MTQKKQLVNALKEALKIAEANIKNAHNIDLEDMSQTLESYIDDLDQIDDFEIYDEDF